MFILLVYLITYFRCEDFIIKLTIVTTYIPDIFRMLEFSKLLYIMFKLQLHYIVFYVISIYKKGFYIKF